MAKLSLSKDVQLLETDASLALKWLTAEGVKLATGGPKAIAALGVLLTAVEQELNDVQTANVNAAIAEIKPVWADVKAFVADFGIKL